MLLLLNLVPSHPNVKKGDKKLEIFKLNLPHLSDLSQRHCVGNLKKRHRFRSTIA